MGCQETQSDYHYFWKDDKSQKALENLNDDSFWSIMENDSMRAHLEDEAYKVTDLIARHWGNENTSKSKLHQMTCESLDEDSFWSIMKNEDMHAHLKNEAY